MTNVDKNESRRPGILTLLRAMRDAHVVQKAEWTLLNVLIQRLDCTNYSCFPGYPQLAKDTQLSIQTLSRAASALKQKGLIDYVERPNHSHMWFVNAKELIRLAATERAREVAEWAVSSPFDLSELTEGNNVSEFPTMASSLPSRTVQLGDEPVPTREEVIRRLVGLSSRIGATDSEAAWGDAYDRATSLGDTAIAVHGDGSGIEGAINESLPSDMVSYVGTTPDGEQFVALYKEPRQTAALLLQALTGRDIKVSTLPVIAEVSDGRYSFLLWLLLKVNRIDESLRRGLMGAANPAAYLYRVLPDRMKKYTEEADGSNEDDYEEDEES